MNDPKTPRALMTAFCVLLSSIFLTACNLSESNSPSADTSADKKLEPKSTAVGSILYSQQFMRIGEGGTISSATEPGLVADALDASGNNLGLEDGDKITFSGAIGGNPSGTTSLVYAKGASGTTVQDLLDKIRETFALPEHDGTAENNLSVEIDPPGSFDGIPDGAIVIRGRPGKIFAIRDVSIRAFDSNYQRPSPNFFNMNLNFRIFREAADTGAIMQGMK